MATYNPPSQLFRRQIESIRRQSWTNWHCFVSDDASSDEASARMQEVIGADDRFTLSVSATRLGFYRNFERSLQMVPVEFCYFALADQDDSWQPEKLQALFEQFDDNTALTYSDARIVDAAGRVIADSAFFNRDANCHDLVSMVMSNSVTGAAALFSGKVLQHALPFPAGIEGLAHDQWLACVSLACGKAKYLPRCLYDYVQHGENAIGFHDAIRSPWFKLLFFGLKVMMTSKGRQAAE
ncbi:MAG TPA: glycosyltransferase, partial [Blastocatellia bacterium]|nr:glycosyltransferase [Blastocatellia bacterium]